jgi:hypothetical protein
MSVNRELIGIIRIKTEVVTGEFDVLPFLEQYSCANTRNGPYEIREWGCELK